jgi:glycerol-3-phosphate acyltransferase PlsY
LTSADVVKTALLVLGAYLAGSVPGAYLAGRLLRGIDLRQYGSGTVSGSMVYEHVARWAIVPVGVFDVGKVALATWMGLRLGLGQPVALAAGLAATIGHNWPIFLGFKGGRGISGFLGILLVLFPWGTLWILILLAIGWQLGDSAPVALIGLLTLPLLGRLTGGPPILVPATIVMTILALVKRLEANRRTFPPPGPERRRVIVRRLLLDRDIASHREWIDRRPDKDLSANTADRVPDQTEPVAGR